MRARNIKPSLFKNEVLGTADPLLTILFEGLWCEADRDGRLEDRPLRLKAEVLPYRNDANVDAMLDWLSEYGFIARYEANGLKVIQVLKFSDHQRPHNNEVESVLPSMEAIKHNQGKKRAQPRKKALRSDSPSLIPSSLIPDSGSLIPDSLSKISIPSGSHSDTSEDVDRVFEHWKVSWDHPKAALDPKRITAIKRALKGYSVADLCACISGYRNSPHHTGQNDRQTVYDDIGLLLRDSAHIDAGIRFAEKPQALTSDLANHNVAVLKGWTPGDSRDDSARRTEISSDHGGSRGGLRKAALAGPH